ncbi:MAG: GNAT family N-acetyltransferase, partial [Candidatus Hodarchaeota archaeon]
HVEQFTMEKSEFDKYVNLIRTTYLDDSPEGRATIFFDEDTFHFLFGSPSIPRDNFCRVIHEATGQIVGFVGSIPRGLHYDGTIYKVTIPAWGTVHPDHQRKGLAVMMAKEFLKIGLETMEYDGGIPAFEAGAHGKGAAQKFTRESGMEMQELVRVNKFIIKILDMRKVTLVNKLKWYEKFGMKLFSGVKKVNNPRVRKMEPRDHDRLYELMDDHLKYNELSLVRDKEDFEWYLEHPVVNCVVHEDEHGVVDGFVVAWKFNLAGFGHIVPFGWLDLVHTYRLSTKEAADMFKYLCVTSKDLGWAGIQSPFIPYFNPGPLRKANFIFYPKVLTLGLFKLSEMPIPNKVKSFYFDFR